jgi:formate-dependent nitrite reductase membrane component NrfD
MIKLGENLQRHQIVIVTVILVVDGGMAVFSVYKALADGRWPWVLMVAVCLFVVLCGRADLRAMRANLRELLKRRNR